MFKRVSSITSAVGSTTGLVECNGEEETELTATQAISAQAESAQEAVKVPKTAKEAPGAEREKKGSEAQTTGNNGQAAPVRMSEDFPNKDTTFVDPYEAGDTFDVPVRIYIDYTNGTMGGAMMSIMDITGLSGAVGVQQVMSSPRDGYTLLVAPAGYAMQYAKESCEFTYEDFRPVSLFVTFYLGVAVNTSSDIKTYEDLVQAVKSRPEELEFDIVTGGLPMLCVLAMEKQEGVDFNIVDIGGTTSKAPELLSDRIGVMIDSLAGLTSYMGSGDFTILGLYADDRLANYPDVPTLAELGYRTNMMNQIFGIWIPKDTPDDVMEYLSSLSGAATADEGIQEQLTDLTYSASYIPTAEYATYLEKMYTDFQEFAKGLNQT